MPSSEGGGGRKGGGSRTAVESFDQEGYSAVQTVRARPEYGRDTRRDTRQWSSVFYKAKNACSLWCLQSLVTHIKLPPSAGRAGAPSEPGGFVTHVLMFDCWELCRMSVAPVLRRSGGGVAASMGATHGLPRPFALAGSLPQKMCVCCCAVRVLYESNFLRVRELLFPAAFKGLPKAVGCHGFESARLRRPSAGGSGARGGGGGSGPRDQRRFSRARAYGRDVLSLGSVSAASGSPAAPRNDRRRCARPRGTSLGWV